ncbi:hypothetical protein NGRA_3241 [Nosema granulosis]|uniref:Uncharacterized protein n=1 Tax=Nosema granulosis TaxID=83296 RepID=A0A9P6GYC6_9MICR|nr:hypothetical protein NGRA_3241 [Nosema granulosis]
MTFRNKMVLLSSYLSICLTSNEKFISKQNYISRQVYCDNITDNKESIFKKRKYNPITNEGTSLYVEHYQNRTEKNEKEQETENSYAYEQNQNTKKAKRLIYFEMKNIIAELKNLNTDIYADENSNCHPCREYYINHGKILPIVVKSDKVSLKKWKEVTNVFVMIFGKFYKFLMSQNFEFNSFEIFECKKTVENIDSFLSSVMDELMPMKLILPPNTYKGYFIRIEEFNKILCDKKYKVHGAMLHLSIYAKKLSRDMNFRDLIILLLHKIKNNNFLFHEIKSVILTVFYQYPTEEFELKDEEYVDDFKSIVSKIILLVETANYRKNCVEESERCVKNVNHLISRNLLLYFSKYNVIRREKRLKNCKETIIELIGTSSYSIIPIDPYNLIFIDFMLGKNNIVYNYCEPVLILKYNEKYKKYYNESMYSYVIKAIERLYTMVDIILKI